MLVHDGNSQQHLRIRHQPLAFADQPLERAQRWIWR
jgi:hypothetical protein